MTDVCAWLIEWPEDDNNPVRWWNPAHGWMLDAHKALGFARQTDADCYLSTMKFGLHLKVTEHIFVGPEYLPGPPQRVGWQTVETAPKDIEVLMCWEVEWPERRWEYASGLWGSTRGGWNHGQATHWMLLPSPPLTRPELGSGK